MIMNNNLIDVELLIYTNGVFPRYRKQAIRHSDKHLANQAIHDYFGIEAGSFVRRVQVAVVDNEEQAQLLKSTFKTYFNKMGTNLLTKKVA